jgi:hypothetical protein
LSQPQLVQQLGWPQPAGQVWFAYAHWMAVPCPEQHAAAEAERVSGPTHEQTPFMQMPEAQPAGSEHAAPLPSCA